MVANGTNASTKATTFLKVALRRREISSWYVVTPTPLHRAKLVQLTEVRKSES